MGKAKEIVLKPISSKESNAIVKRLHYSGKVVQNSQIHIGVYYRGRLEGAMQFGPSLDKRKIIGLVDGTGWNQFIELNRMAFSDVLPRNSESRAMAIAFKLLRKHAPHLKWVISFADATQCGDGGIYRAAGFVLTAIKKNNAMWELPDDLAVLNNGRVTHRMKVHDKGSVLSQEVLRRTSGKNATMEECARLFGGHILPGYQMRYIYFIDKSWRQRLTVEEIPFSRIDEMGATMYKGKHAGD